MDKKYIVCAHREWSKKMYNSHFSMLNNFYLIDSKDKLTQDYVNSINPDIVFFLDWSWIIDEKFLNSFYCVGFHSAPLPEFRGGSPIQNQIINGVLDTKLTAFKMDPGIDTGNILLQSNLSLRGHISEIFDRIAKLACDMMVKIINNEYVETKQVGEGSYFKRRLPKESELKLDKFTDTTYLYNFIRMLEDPYPNAFINIGNYKLIFKSAELHDNDIACNVIIKRNNE